MQPRLRFKEFNTPLSSKKIIEIANVSTGNKDTQNKVDDGQYPFFVRSQTVERINSYSLDCEAILTSGDGVGVGKNFHYINGKFDFHQRVYCLNNFNKTINGKFIFYLFSEKFYKRVKGLSAKNSVDSIRRDMITEMEVYVPTLFEQTKIASFLSAVDKKITQLTKKHELLTQYKKGVMQKIFSQELRFKADDGRDYPDWVSKKIGDALTIGSGKDYKHLSEGDIPVYGTGGYMLSVNKYLYDGDSVGIGRKGTIDKPVFLTGKFWTVDTLFFTHSFKECLPKFIYYVFLGINWKSHSEASGVPSLSKSTIEKLPIFLPTIPEQTKVANFLSAIDDKIQNTQSQLEATKQYKQGLLQQMFV